MLIGNTSRFCIVFLPDLHGQKDGFTKGEGCFRFEQEVRLSISISSWLSISSWYGRSAGYFDLETTGTSMWQVSHDMLQWYISEILQATRISEKATRILQWYISKFFRPWPIMGFSLKCALAVIFGSIPSKFGAWENPPLYILAKLSRNKGLQSGSQKKIHVFGNSLYNSLCFKGNGYGFIVFSKG